MGTINDLVRTENMAPNKKPLLTDLDQTLDSIQTYINVSIKNNLQQFNLDAFPTGYPFNNDGNKWFATYDLFNKQTQTPTIFTSADIDISMVVGSFTDVDASNAQITFVPDRLTGNFGVSAQFSVSIVTTNATNEAAIGFRLIDGNGNVSSKIFRLHQITGVNATTNVYPVTLYHQFLAMPGSVSQTVKLQYFTTISTATTIKVEANTNSPLVMLIEKI